MKTISFTSGITKEHTILTTGVQTIYAFNKDKKAWQLRVMPCKDKRNKYPLTFK